MFTGTVKWFNNAKGFGFVVPDAKVSDSGEQDTHAAMQAVEQRDVFAHYSEIDMTGYKALKAGQLITFDIKAGDKGEQAVSIRPILKVELAQPQRGDSQTPGARTEDSLTRSVECETA